jgi:hypothetical protein
MVSIWNHYPVDYRKAEVLSLARSLRSGDCAALVGLSGSGKSNLAGFLTYRAAITDDSAYAGLPSTLLIDCNRLRRADLPELFGELQRQMMKKAGDKPSAGNLKEAESIIARAPLDSIISVIEPHLAQNALVLVFDRFDVFFNPMTDPAIFSNMRSLRDHFKYRLTYLICTRRLLPKENELAELFFSATTCLGPLSASDANWSASSYADRHQLKWSQSEINLILELSGRYPSFLRAICESYEAGVSLQIQNLLQARPVQARLDEFWDDKPTEKELLNCGLAGLLLLQKSRQDSTAVAPHLTAKEQLLLDYLSSHADQVCEKDDLIRAVWPEDRVFFTGIRDDSLAQLVRRLREKIEANPSSPEKLVTAPGRGYIYTGDRD